jgi:predicted Zn finger-like uncharacterized protein
MVIQCPECRTRFKLSDDKIKPEGIRIRCAKCRHIFPVHPEEASDPVETSVVPPTPESSITSPPPDLATENESSETDDLRGAFDNPDTAPSDVQTRESTENTGTEETAAAADNEEIQNNETSLGLTDLPEPLAKVASTKAVEPDGRDDFDAKDFDLPAAPPEAAESAETIAEKPLAEDDWESETVSVPPVTPVEEGLENFDFGLGETSETEPVEKSSVFEEDEEVGLPADPPEATESAETIAEKSLSEDDWESETVSTPPATPAEEGVDDFDFGLDETPETEPVEESLVFEGNEEVASPDELSLAETPAVDISAESSAVGLSLDAFSFEEKSTDGPETGASEFSLDETGGDDFFLTDDTLNDGDSFNESPPVATGSGDSVGSLSPAGVDSGFEGDPFASSTDGSDDFEFGGISFGEENASIKTDTPAASDATVPLQPVKPPTEKTLAKRPESGSEGSAVLSELPKKQRKSPVAKVLRIFLVLLLVLVAAAGYLVWQSGTADVGQVLNQLLSKNTSEMTVVHIRLPLPKSFFIMSREAGQLFVVQGEAVNGYPKTRSAISVRGRLHDKKKKVLMQKTVFCGNSLSLETLKTAPFAQIEEAMNNQFGNALSNLNIASGKAITYMIVFRDLPPDVTEFTIEVADSKPGGSP